MNTKKITEVDSTNNAVDSVFVNDNGTLKQASIESLGGSLYGGNLDYINYETTEIISSNAIIDARKGLVIDGHDVKPFIELDSEAEYEALTEEEKAQNCYVYDTEEVEPSAETIAYEQGGGTSIKTVVENGIYENITNSLSISKGLSTSRKNFIKSGCIYDLDVFIFADDNPMTNNAIIATISEEHRPRRQVFLNGACGLRYGNRYPCIFVIGTDGTVKISFTEGGISSVGEACLFGTYIG